MALLNYATHTSVAGAKDLLSKLKDFATAYGWVAENYQTSKVWGLVSGVTYGWIAGDQDFLDLSSTGYGSQVLRFRLLVDPYDASDDTLYTCPIDPANPSVSTASATSAHLQNSWQTTYYDKMSLPRGTIPQVWFFGDAKFILVVVQVSATEVATFAWGLPELDSGLQNDALIWHWPGHYMGNESSTFSWQTLTTNLTYWWNCFGVTFPYQTGYLAHWTAAARATDYVKSNMGIATTAVAGNFTKLDDVLAVNGFTNKRTLVRPTSFLKNVSTGVWYPAGVLPVAYCKFTGLSIGSTITYGAESYLAFPVVLSTHDYGIAVRIA